MTSNRAPLAHTVNSPDVDINDITSGKRTLDLEAKGIQALSNALSGSLGKPFVEALDIISGVTGRLIITGMGKSGHVGRKIASTLASTGTPAFFIHPGEASHGDLGMITSGDAILAMSNSGETSELADTVAHAARFSIPLISITGRSESTLSDAADVALVLPDAPEACPMGLAPTTSTTM